VVSAGTIAALSAGLAGVITSITALLGVVFHRHDPPKSGPGPT